MCVRCRVRNQARSADRHPCPDPAANSRESRLVAAPPAGVGLECLPASGLFLEAVPDKGKAHVPLKVACRLGPRPSGRGASARLRGSPSSRRGGAGQSQGTWVRAHQNPGGRGWGQLLGSLLGAWPRPSVQAQGRPAPRSLVLSTAFMQPVALPLPRRLHPPRLDPVLVEGTRCGGAHANPRGVGCYHGG